MKKDPDDDETTVAKPSTVIRSDGQDTAQGYVEAELPRRPARPALEMERVHVVDPRRSPTLRGLHRAASSPANEGTGEPTPRMRRIVIDPALLARWRSRRDSVDGSDDVTQDDVTRDEVTHAHAPEAAPDDAPDAATLIPPAPGAADPQSRWAAAGKDERLSMSALPSAHRPAEPEAAPAEAPPSRAGRVVAAAAALAVLLFLGLQVARRSPSPASPASSPAAVAPQAVSVPDGTDPRPLPEARASDPAPVSEPETSPVPRELDQAAPDPQAIEPVPSPDGPRRRVVGRARTAAPPPSRAAARADSVAARRSPIEPSVVPPSTSSHRVFGIEP